MNNKLRLGPIPHQQFVRLYIALPADLKADLERYASVHSQTWGHAMDVATLIPHMLETFIAGDRAFKRAVATSSRARP